MKFARSVALLQDTTYPLQHGHRPIAGPNLDLQDLGSLMELINEPIELIESNLAFWKFVMSATLQPPSGKKL